MKKVKSILVAIYKRLTMPFVSVSLLSNQLDKVKKELYYTRGATDFWNNRMDFDKVYKDIEGKQ
jgi:hypothetical protein